MAAEQLSQVVRHLRSMVANQEAAGIADADLLRRYVHERDEAAFETLLRRHGPMVLGVCRRLLHNSHDAEDAFQVTFLVLVRKASGLRSPGTIGNWLYGVAHRTALEARKISAKRREKEAMIVPRVAGVSDAGQQIGGEELRTVLDQELKRLPDKHREVVVLCDLEGKTRKEVAQDLGCAEGTVASRLARARTVLAKRLSRQGLALSGGGVATLLSESAASAALPSALLSSTIQAASAFTAGQAAAGVISANVIALTQGVLRAMLLTKLKMTAAVLMTLAFVGVGAGSLIYRAHAAGDADDPSGVVQKTAQESAPPQGENPLKRVDPDSSVYAAQKIMPLSSDDLRGLWKGEKDGIKVDLVFYGRQAKWPAHWRVEYKMTDEGVIRGSSDEPFLAVHVGADLKVAADPIPGRLNLYLPAYLGDKKEIKESSWNGKTPVGEIEKIDAGTIRLRIIPTGYDDPANNSFDFPAVEGLILHRVEEKEKQVSEKAATPAGEDITVEAMPPVVVKTVPQAGLTNVDAKTTEIQVTFSKDMTDESWSWSQLGDETFPKIIGKPKYLKDKRTCVATVKLEPDKTYAIWLNSERFGNFKDADGRSAVPYLLVFKTAK
jgi:RNA polymerase sigma factor (sigma-70 family)